MVENQVKHFIKEAIIVILLIGLGILIGVIQTGDVIQARCNKYIYDTYYEISLYDNETDFYFPFPDVGFPDNEDNFTPKVLS